MKYDQEKTNFSFIFNLLRTPLKPKKKQANIEHQPQLEAAEKSAKEILKTTLSFKSQNKTKKTGEEIGILIYALFNDGPGLKLWEKAKHYIYG